MRLLKFLVIFMGVLILIGTIILVVTLLNRMENKKSTLFDNDSDKAVKIDTYKSKGMSLIHTSSLDSNLVLTFSKGNNYLIIIIRPSSGEILKTIEINN